MNNALIADKPAACPLRAAAPSRLAAWLQRVAVTAAARRRPGQLRRSKPAPPSVNGPTAASSAAAGTLWLTFDNEPEDIVLEAGESHRCAKSSRLSIHALAAAVVRVA